MNRLHAGADIAEDFGDVFRIETLGAQLGGALTSSLTPWIAKEFGWTASFLVAAALCMTGSITRQREHMIAPNGIGLSPDEKVVYAADTQLGRLWAFAQASCHRASFASSVRLAVPSATSAIDPTPMANPPM